MALRAELDKLRQTLRPEFMPLYQHCDDAVNSMANNIAEGNDSIYPKTKRRFFDIAAGSGNEARSALKSLGEQKAFGNASVYRAVGLCIVAKKMLEQIIHKL